MKILKYILVILVVLVILFFTIGLMNPTIQYGHEVSVNKSLQESWAVSGDESKTSQWIDGLKSEELLSGEKGEVGSTYKVTVNPGEGQDDFIMTETIVSKKDMDHVTMHFESDMMDFDQTMSFADAGGKTTIKTESTVKGKGIALQSLFAAMEMLGGSFQKQEEKNVEALKRVIEENSTDYFAEDSTVSK